MAAKAELKNLQALLERNGKRIEELTSWVTKDERTALKYGLLLFMPDKTNKT